MGKSLIFLVFLFLFLFLFGCTGSDTFIVQNVKLQKLFDANVVGESGQIPYINDDGNLLEVGGLLYDKDSNVLLSNADLNIFKFNPILYLTNSGGSYVFVKKGEDKTVEVTNKIPVGVDTTTDQVPAMTNYTVPSGVVSASTEFSTSYRAWYAFRDDGGSSRWVSTTSQSQFLRYQFVSPKNIGSYSIRNTLASNCSTAWTFQGSTDGLNWTTLDIQTGQSFVDNEEKTYSFSNTDYYLYYQILFSARAGGSNYQISEVQMFNATPEDDLGVTFIKSELSTNDGIYGKHTFGHSSGETVIDGSFVSLDSGGVEVARVTSSGFGVGTSSPSASVHVISPASSSREPVMKLGVSDGGNDALYLSNATTTASSFLPTFIGYQDTSNAAASLNVQGMVSSGNDASDSANIGIVDFIAMRTSSATDPINGTRTAIVNRKLFSWRNLTSLLMYMTPNGNLFLPNDSQKVLFGGGNDASITYNGTNLLINPREVGSGNTIFSAGNVGIGTTSPSELLDINGTIKATEYKSSDGSVGISINSRIVKDVNGDGTFYCDMNYKNGLLVGSDC